jgi:regulator of replication initiation timing
MTDPFRDELTAALTRAGELEAENEELRARLEVAQSAQKNSAEEARTAVTSSQGVASNMRRENEELRDKLAKSAAEVREANDRTYAAVRNAPNAAAQGQMALLVFTGFIGFVLGLAVAYMRHC